jgi:hypothetical protein
MSQGQIPKTPRARDPMIDVVKLHLLTNINMIRAEIIAFQSERRRWVRLPMGLEDFLLNKTKKEINEEDKLYVNSINDRLAYILEIAKNLLRDVNDPENLEYHRFENLAKSLVERTLYKKTWFGLKKKAL